MTCCTLPEPAQVGTRKKRAVLVFFQAAGQRQLWAFAAQGRDGTKRGQAEIADHDNDGDDDDDDDDGADDDDADDDDDAADDADDDGGGDDGDDSTSDVNVFIQFTPPEMTIQVYY